MDIFEDIDDILFNIDLEELVEAVYPNREYNVRHRPDHMNMWDDNEFFKRFRLSKQTVAKLLTRNKRTIITRNQPISPLGQLLLTLRFCATGSFYITMGDFGGIHKSTAGRIISRAINAIAELRPQYIYMPRTD
ncbi:hypothetical protein NQ314_017685 [Rhamnusium bicolor]|uniref:Nuclease HARBI1 n=1 Tax=Rhamnusium bicolor TaxID=1586634 RepID=A0AAV8WSX0_9CUCU|nr:hypothetical protein NQ314_017685 [Rhamnusium bicolor]